MFLLFKRAHIYLGSFKTFDEAVKARKEAEIKYEFTCDDVYPKYDRQS